MEVQVELEFELLQSCAGVVMKFKINLTVVLVTDSQPAAHMEAVRQWSLLTDNTLNTLRLYGFLTHHSAACLHHRH